MSFKNLFFDDFWLFQTWQTQTGEGPCADPDCAARVVRGHSFGVFWMFAINNLKSINQPIWINDLNQYQQLEKYLLFTLGSVLSPRSRTWKRSSKKPNRVLYNKFVKIKNTHFPSKKAQTKDWRGRFARFRWALPSFRAPFNGPEIHCVEQVKQRHPARSVQNRRNGPEIDPTSHRCIYPLWHRLKSSSPSFFGSLGLHPNV